MHAETSGRLDALVERLGRRTAGKTTRRSFLGKAGRVAVVVAGGPALVGLLADTAQARVCGQSGVAPKCPTFDCDRTWGWCWYASGCCAGGRLKKICDCCAPNTPHPVGYCPSGTRVYCIVESCDADPRLQTRDHDRIATDDPAAISVATSRLRFRTSAPIAVVGDAENALMAAVAASTGRVVGGPVLLSGRSRLSPAVAEELRRLRVEFVKVIGSHLSGAVDTALQAQGIKVERIGTSQTIQTFSAQVASWSRSMTGSRTAVVVTAGVPELAAGAAAAFAHSQRLPLLIGSGDAVQAALREPRPVRTSYVITTDSGDVAAFPGGHGIVGSSEAQLATRIADTAIGMGTSRSRAMLVSRNNRPAAAASATMPVPVILHSGTSMAGARDWLLANQPRLAGVYAVGSRDHYTTQAQWELQSHINEFGVHLLRGQAGEGLPVISQPPEERPIGSARR
jgi:hypothetical protein